MSAVLRSVGFTLLALALGAPFALLYGWLGGDGLGAAACGVGYMFSPLGASVLLARRAGRPLKEAVGLRWRLGWAWLGAWGWPIVIALLAVVVTFQMPGVSYDPGMGGLIERLGGQLEPEVLADLEDQLAALPAPPLMLTLALVQATVAGTTINAVAALGEEAGWRGWMHGELASLGFWRRALVTGVLWGLWHAPLILQGHNYPEHPGLGVLWMVAMCVGLSGPLAHLRERTGTVLSAAVFHGVFNGVAGLPLLYAAGGSDLTIGVTGLAGLIVLAGANVVLAVLRRREV